MMLSERTSYRSLAACLVCLALLAWSDMPASAGPAPALDALPLLDKVKQHDITWTFAKPVRVGQFVNGDYYVVGPVTITAIDPAPADGRHGSILNLSSKNAIGFDGRINNRRYNDDLPAKLPIDMKPGDMLISSKSAERKRMHRCLFDTESNISPVWSYSALTCVEAPVRTDAFRPGYCDRKLKLYYADDLQWHRLNSLAKVEGTPDIARWAQLFRQPWVDLVGFSFAAAAEYQPQYAREIARAEAFATLLLNLDFTEEEKRPLLINFVQYGIDLWSIIESPDARDGWAANGGHGTGRKWGIVFAGLMLGDAKMASPTKTHPDAKFGQDMQTMFDKAWTGANVVYAGHRGVWLGKPVSNKPAQMPYEHLHPSKWAFETFQYPGRAKPTTQYSCEVYRRTINSPVYVGLALAGRIMHAEEAYAHDAFFAYVDRWMTEDDAPLREEIMKSIDVENTKHDFRKENFHSGRVRDPFVKAMWEAYRNKLPPAQPK